MMARVDTKARLVDPGGDTEYSLPSQAAGSRPAVDLSQRVAAACDGDEHAFRDVYRAVQPGLLRYLRVLVGEDAEDVASEAWLQIVRDLGAFRGGDKDFRAWTATIARHRAQDHLRARARRPQTAVAPIDLDDTPAASDTATAALDAVATREAIALIATLPRDQAEAVLLRVVVGLDATGAGQVLGKRAGAVRTSAYRGLRRLADLLDRRRQSASEAYKAPDVTRIDVSTLKDV
jgi:RNA polymerase sigma-70 factor (ECF subfamily)